MELKDMQETAALARIGMSDDDLEKTFPAFEQMLSFFAVMKDGCNTFSEHAEDFTAAKTAASGCLRPDTAAAPDEDLFESMLSQAPERDGRFFVIPNVL
jgi:aspartyl-tRNA(Asn)/glutamyl-tRNA(Gln) amidotransferase subunit C